MKFSKEKKFTVTLEVFINDGEYDFKDLHLIIDTFNETNRPGMEVQIKSIKEEGGEQYEKA